MWKCGMRQDSTSVYRVSRARSSFDEGPREAIWVVKELQSLRAGFKFEAARWHVSDALELKGLVCYP